MDSLQPKLTYRPKHKLEVFFTGGTARITRDGQLLACSCGEEVKVVDVATGTVLRTLPGDSEPVTALAVSPDSKTLVVASRSTTCRVYDMTTGELQRTWRAHKSPVADLAIDASGGYVATASADRLIKVWDLQAGFCTHSFSGHSGVVLRVLFHPKQLQLYSGGDDAEVRVWDLVEKKCVALLKSHFSAVTSLALSTDGWVLLSGGRDKVVTAWDLRTHAKLTTVPVYEGVEGVVTLPLGSPFPGVPSPTDAAAIVKKGAAKPVYFATAGEKGRIKIWRSDTASCVYEHAGLAAPQQGAGQATSTSSSTSSASQEYTDLMMVPGGQALLASTADARLMFYKPDKATSQLSLYKQLIGNVDEVTDVRLVGGTKHNPTHVAVATNCEVIQLFDVETLSCSASCIGHRDTILSLDAAFGVGPEGTGLLISGGKDNEVRVWSVPSGRCVAIGIGHVGSVSAVTLARKNPSKFMISAGADKLLKVWDLEAALEANANGVEAAAVQPKKKSKQSSGAAAPPTGIAAGSVIQMHATAAIAAHDKDINSVAVSPNDQLVATGSQDKTARVWKLPSLTPHLVLRGHKRGVWAVEFSPVDQALITASGDKTIKMWALSEGGSCIRTFEGHQASVLRACFITAGTQIVSAGADGLVKLWSLKSDECVSTFDEHQGKIWAMTSGGQSESMLVTGGADACVCLWQDVTAADAAAAEEAEEALVGKEQALANALVDGDYSTAAKLAFELRHPGRLLQVVQRAAAAGQGTVPHIQLLGSASTAVVAGQATSDLLSQLVHHMSDEDIKIALQYCREWNTNSRHCHAAQAMLKALLRHKKPGQLTSIPGIGELMDGLMAYSSRHFARVDRLLRSTRLLDYSLAAMKVLSREDMTSEAQSQEESMDEDNLEQPQPVIKPVVKDHGNNSKAITAKQQTSQQKASGSQPHANGHVANGVHQHSDSDGSDSEDEQQGQQQNRLIGDGEEEDSFDIDSEEDIGEDDELQESDEDVTLEQLENGLSPGSEDESDEDSSDDDSRDQQLSQRAQQPQRRSIANHQGLGLSNVSSNGSRKAGQASEHLHVNGKATKQPVATTNALSSSTQKRKPEKQ